MCSSDLTYAVGSTDVRRLWFEYYESGDTHGGSGDLMRLTLQAFDGTTWQDLQHTLLRYYTEDGAHGFAHGLKFQLKPESYERMVNDGLNPETATDAQMAGYADKFFEYDGDKRVTREDVQGGSQSFGYGYFESTNPDGYNSWKVKTTETLPDGSERIVYTNFAAQVMLKVLQSGSSKWYSFNRYDDNGRVIMAASSSAVTGYDDEYADLLNFDGDTCEYLSDDSGLIQLNEYFTTGAVGYLKKIGRAHV